MGFEDYFSPLNGNHNPSLPVSRPSVAEGAELQLRNNPYRALQNISCEYHEGVLTLRGCLPTWYLKQLAQTVVAHLAGVERIVNQIQVIAARQ
jgi:osmotically-inducible protein OsmY